MLTFRFQKELAKGGNAIVSTIPHDVTNTDVIASYARNDAVNTPTIISDIRRNALKSSEDTRGQGLGASAIQPLPVTE